MFYAHNKVVSVYYVCLIFHRIATPFTVKCIRDGMHIRAGEKKRSRLRVLVGTRYIRIRNVWEDHIALPHIYDWNKSNVIKHSGTAIKNTEGHLGIRAISSGVDVITGKSSLREIPVPSLVWVRPGAWVRAVRAIWDLLHSDVRTSDIEHSWIFTGIRMFDSFSVETRSGEIFDRLLSKLSSECNSGLQQYYKNNDFLSCIALKTFRFHWSIIDGCIWIGQFRVMWLAGWYGYLLRLVRMLTNS